MIKKYVKPIITVIMSLVIIFEIICIVRMNMLVSDEVAEPTATSEPLPVIGMHTSMPEIEGTAPTEEVKQMSKIIVIDPGHGKSSSLMSSDEKAASGWVKNSVGQWGEWRHYKIGSGTVDCSGSGCNGRVTPNGACWYAIGSGDRNTEPDINLQNALAAKRHLESMGYTVRMTRTSNDENPSITKRLSYCYPGNNPNNAPDAAAFICIHSNAAGGGARGSAYISAQGPYDQAWIDENYVETSNKLGKLCNDYIVSDTSLTQHGNGVIAWEPELIAFCKSPVTCAYLEIGFFDNSSDLAILKSESDAIGYAIAKGVDEYCRNR